MNLDKETWDVANSYFRDTPNYLVKHHIDSYNDFIKNKIPLVFKNFNNQKVFRFDQEEKDLSYEINIYYGGKDGNGFKITKPTIINHATGEKKLMYPNEARLKNLTYGFDFFIDIDADFTIKRGNNIIMNKQPIYDNSFLKNIYVGKIPIMLHSDLCILSNMEGEVLNQMGECRYDPGGYFVIDGREKVIVSLERKAENIVFLQKINNPNDKYTHTAEIKSISNEAFTYSRTVKLQLEKTGCITVRLGQKRPFLQPVKGRDVPLFIMFRAMGIETDKEILEFILGDLDTPLSQKMLKILHNSIIDPYVVEGQIYDRETAEGYLEKLPSRAVAEGNDKISEIHTNKAARLALLYQALQENFLPHCGNDFRAKAYFLAYMTRKLLFRTLDLEEDTDRDNFINKRIDISGSMMANLFRDAFNQLKRFVKIEINRTYINNYKEYSEERFPFIINENNYYRIFNHEVFKNHFLDSIKRGTLGAKQGVVQSLERVNYYATVSQLRRIADPASGSEVTLSRRRLHTTQYGGICPFETPEGQNVGLRKALSMTALVTFNITSDAIISLLVKYGLIKLSDISLKDYWKSTKVIVNGNIIGCHNNPLYLEKVFKLYRRNGLINIYISISFDNISNEFKINTDNGRIVRPLYIVENNVHLIQPKHIDMLNKGDKKFIDLVIGFAKRDKELDFLKDEVNDLSSIGINENKDDVIELLKDNQCVIEYLDVQELSRSMLTRGFNIDPRNHEVYTHSEIHTSLALGMCANLVPFIQNASAPRGIFASKQIKQGASMYATNYRNRIDTSVHLLNYPNKPLTLGRLHKFLNNDKMCTGQNLCVAICHYNGFNADDGIIGSKSNIQMGMLNTSYFKMYEEVEKVDSKRSMSELFYNPNYLRNDDGYGDGDSENEGNIGKKIANKELNYDHLDKYGFVKEGTYLEGGEVLIGKYIKSVDESNRETMSDLSKKVKKDNVNSMVDKVFTCQVNANGDRLVKVRTCQYRYPQIGDKLASRCAQKGTFGVLLNREDMPYTEDGLVPDILLTPYGYPSRMTVNQFLEILFGNLATELGFFGLGSPNEPINPYQINDILCDKLGLTDYGDRIMYNGITGEQMHVKIYTGVIYYQRLKYMVNDKINVRASGQREDGIALPGGAYTFKERQVVPGRAMGGGLRMGEMERDVMLAHGTMSFLKESAMERGDKFYVYVSDITGEICFVNPEENLYFDPSVDGPVNYQLKDNANSSEGILGINIEKQTSREFHKVIIPYTLKLLIQEMQGLMINTRVRADKLKLVIKTKKINKDSLDIDDEFMDSLESELNIDYDADVDIDELMVYDGENEDDMVLEGGGEGEGEGEGGEGEGEGGEGGEGEGEGGSNYTETELDLDNSNPNVNIPDDEGVQLGGMIIPSNTPEPNLNPDISDTSDIGSGFKSEIGNQGTDTSPQININIQQGGSNIDSSSNNGISEKSKTENESTNEIKTITIEGGGLNPFGNFTNKPEKKKRNTQPSFGNTVKEIEYNSPDKNGVVYGGGSIPDPFADLDLDNEQAKDNMQTHNPN